MSHYLMSVFYFPSIDWIIELNIFFLLIVRIYYVFLQSLFWLVLNQIHIRYKTHRKTVEFVGTSNYIIISTMVLSKARALVCLLQCRFSSRYRLDRLSHMVGPIVKVSDSNGRHENTSYQSHIVWVSLYTLSGKTRSILASKSLSTKVSI